MTGTEGNEGPESVGDILDDLLERTARDSVAPMRMLVDAWGRLMKRDATLGSTRIAAYRKGVVVIEVSSPPVCAELAQFRRMEVLERLRRELREEVAVKELRFRLGAFRD